MKQGSAFILALVVSALFLSGCATTGRNAAQENDNLKIQMQNFQTQLQQKDAEIESLRKALSSTTEEKYSAARLTRAASRGVSTEHPSGKDIQTALVNAGFDPGTLDGKLGKKTRQAIKDFQKANALDADGKVGKRTWVILSPYLEKQASN
jgi:peptidoglycan hydrolase-like protein with peptidoglycan-binding domain